MNTTIKLYYAVLGVCLMATIGHTLFSGGTTVFNTQRVAELKREQQLVLHEQQQLQRELASNLSIAQLSVDKLSQFEPIRSPIVIESYTMVAVANQ